MKNATITPMKKMDMERSKIGCPMMKVSKRPISDQSQAAIVVKVESRPLIDVVSGVDAARAGNADRAVMAIDVAKTITFLSLRIRVNRCFIKHLLK